MQEYYGSSRFAPASVVPPPQAAALGYNLHTFGSALTLNSNWYPFNFLSVTPNAGQAVQSGSGLYLPGADGSGYGANVCTAKQNGSSWSGIAFGGGFYAEALISIVPTISGTPGVLPFPAFWADDVSWLAHPATPTPPSWIGGLRHIEWDIFQWVRDTTAYYSSSGLIDWYGSSGGKVALPTPGETHMPDNFVSAHRYGGLYDPATSGSAGYITSWLDGVQVMNTTGSQTIGWNQFNPSDGTTPSAGTSAGSYIDVSHLALILGTAANCAMTVYSVDVWQGAGATNWIQ